jgi:hypothetical protein
LEKLQTVATFVGKLDTKVDLLAVETKATADNMISKLDQVDHRLDQFEEQLNAPEEKRLGFSKVSLRIKNKFILI